jgi:hypothetical protein
MDAESRSIWDGMKERALLLVIMALTAVYVSVSPSGFLGFMKSVERADIFSISVLASLIALVFVLLNKSGFSFSQLDEIEIHRSTSNTSR